mmetsp:Transcript_13587/g.36760  ORF Transcript_13587/g.36760 Transcript_13587/m.36760 type:complete len:223 (+) Transcript_13587:237-905(+)
MALSTTTREWSEGSGSLMLVGASERYTKSHTSASSMARAEGDPFAAAARLAPWKPPAASASASGTAGWEPEENSRPAQSPVASLRMLSSASAARAMMRDTASHARVKAGAPVSMYASVAAAALPHCTQQSHNTLTALLRTLRPASLDALPIRSKYVIASSGLWEICLPKSSTAASRTDTASSSSAAHTAACTSTCPSTRSSISIALPNALTARLRSAVLVAW